MWSSFETLPADSLCSDSVLIFFRKSHSISSVALNMKSTNKKYLWKLIFWCFFMNKFLWKNVSLYFFIHHHDSIPARPVKSDTNGIQSNLTVKISVRPEYDQVRVYWTGDGLVCQRPAGTTWRPSHLHHHNTNTQTITTLTLTLRSSQH